MNEHYRPHQLQQPSAEQAKLIIFTLLVVILRVNAPGDSLKEDTCQEYYPPPALPKRQLQLESQLEL